MTDINTLNNTLTEARKNQTRLEKEKERYETNLIQYAEENAVGSNSCADYQEKKKEYGSIVKKCIGLDVPLKEIFEIYEKICNPTIDEKKEKIKKKCATEKTDREKRSVSLYMDGQKAESKVYSKRPTQGKSYRSNPFFSKK